MQEIIIHPKEDFEGMRRAGRLAAEVLDMITPFVRKGVTTAELDKICQEYIESRGAVCACLGYRGYPKATCISLNHVVCHGIPSERRLEDGDILNIDITVILNGWYGDTSRMFGIGKLPVKAKRLIDVTYETMMRGIEQVKEGATLGDVGYAMQKFAEKNRCSTVRDYCGHGLGRVFHTAPNVLNFGRPHEGLVLKEGMFFTVEPMVNLGGCDTLTLSDGWTTITRDRSLSAQFEHSLAVTKNGCELFTVSPKGWHKPPYDP